MSGGEQNRTHPAYTFAAQVVAEGALYSDLVIGLGVVDSRARVTHFGSDNRDPTAAYNDVAWKSFNRCHVAPAPHARAELAYP